MNIQFIVGIYMILFKDMIIGEVQHYPTGINWFDASTKCGETGLEHDSLTLENLEQLKGHEFWIGIVRYMEKSSWIQPLGCFNFVSDKRPTTKTESIGLCQRYCRQWSHFSYQKSTKKCQCLRYEDSSYSRTNLSNCLHIYSETNGSFIYKRFDLNTSEDDDCMVSSCDKNVSTLSTHTCNSTGYSVQTLCDDLEPAPGENWSYDYATALARCHSKDKQLLSPEQCSATTGVKSWTSVFRKNVLIEYTSKDNPKTETPFDCLSGNSGNISDIQKINVSPKSCHEKLQYFACRSNLSIKSSTSPVVRPEHDSTSSKTSLNIGLLTTHFIAQHNNTAIKATSSNEGLIGGVVGGIMTVALITLLLLWIHRRRHSNIPKLKKSTANSDNGNQATNMLCGLVGSVNQTVDQNTFVNEGNEMNDKSMYECATSQESHRFSALEDTYVVADEDEYDKLNNITSRKKENDGNIYGITGLCGEDEYDTMKRVLGSNDDLYDTNVHMNSKHGDQTYNSSNILKLKQTGSNDVNAYAK